MKAVPLVPPPDDSYGQDKLAAEKALAIVTARGLSTIVLRPTRIYGPFSRTFTIQAAPGVGARAAGDWRHPDLPANMVYVDTVVAAIERALQAPDALGGSAYLISDPEQISLRDFLIFSANRANWPRV